MPRTNYCANPSAGVDATGYAGGTGTTATRDTTVKYSGTASIKLLKTTTSATAPTYTGIAVVPGDTLAVSAYMNIPAGTFAAFYAVCIYWYNGATYLSYSVIGATAIPANTGNGGVWTRYSVTGTAPASATTAVLVFNSSASMNSGYAYWVDNVLVEKSTTTIGSYFDGDTPADANYTYAWTGTAGESTSVATEVVAAQQSRTNYSANPSIGVDTTGYTAGAGTTATRDTTVMHSGTASLKLLKTTTGATTPYYTGITVVPGDMLAVSAYLNIPAGTFAAFYPVCIYWYNGTTYLSYSVTGATIIPANTGNGGVWTRYSATGTAPASATLALILFNASASMNSGYAYWVDDVLAEKGTTTIGSYFDGDTPADATYTYAWTGTPGESVSVATLVTGGGGTGGGSHQVNVGGVAQTPTRKVNVGGVATSVTRQVKSG